MRSYIFTKRERGILKDFVDGTIVDRIQLSKILHRFRRHTTLATDVELYLRIREAVSAKSA